MSQLSPRQVVRYTNQWCRQRGITPEDLEAHPQADDVVLLIQFREEFWSDMDKSEQGYWSAYWNRVYHKHFPLKAPFYRQLEIITQSVIFKRHKQAQRRATIQAIRAKAKNKMENVYGG